MITGSLKSGLIAMYSAYIDSDLCFETAYRTDGERK